MDECSLCVHEIEFVIDSWEDFSDGSWVGDHANCSHDLGQITSWDNCGWLIVNTAFEASWAPVDELNGSLGLDGGDWGVDIFGDDVTSVHKAASHIFTVSGIAFGHHGSGFESGVGDFSNWELFMISFLGWDNWGVWWQHEMDSRIWHQVGLEFSDIYVQGSIESEGGSQRWNDLGDKSVQVGVGWSFNVEISSADIIDGFVIQHNGNISVFQEGVSWEHWVVWFNDGGWDLWWWIDGETELGFLSIIDGKSFQEEGTETGSSSTTDWVEDEETLETSALISELSDSVEAEINDFFTNGVMSSGEVVGGIFLSWDQLFGVEELSVSTSSDFINNGWF